MGDSSNIDWLRQILQPLPPAPIGSLSGPATQSQAETCFKDATVDRLAKKQPTGKWILMSNTGGGSAWLIHWPSPEKKTTPQAPALCVLCFEFWIPSHCIVWICHV